MTVKKTHPTIIARQLRSKLSQHQIASADLETAHQLAKQTGRIEHIALFSNVKRQINSQEGGDGE
jgi:hypothetical protein